ncbi:hypothetical protein CRUP_003537 [Coryphaenoides rupestris]|nr:hypothetical protein CRUP_003537 [Coryphaenoides rupestris]
MEEDEELEVPVAAECPSQKRASLGLGGLGKDLELSSREAWLSGGGGSSTEQGSPAPGGAPAGAAAPAVAAAATEAALGWPGQGPLYQQSSRRPSSIGGPEGAGQGPPVVLEPEEVVVGGEEEGREARTPATRGGAVGAAGGGCCWWWSHVVQALDRDRRGACRPRHG